MLASFSSCGTRGGMTWACLIRRPEAFARGCGCDFPLEPQLMLICHTRPKNVKYEGGQGAFAGSSLTQLAHTCTAASTRVQEYRRIDSSRASGGGSSANSAALAYSKQGGLTTTWEQICFLFQRKHRSQSTTAKFSCASTLLCDFYLHELFAHVPRLESCRRAPGLWGGWVM